MSGLSGKRVLLVEDEAILAMSIEDMLRDLGCEVVGPALDEAEGKALAAGEEIDAAVVDINMGDGNSRSIADLLKARSVPFCFSTGYGSAGVPNGFADIPVLQKPYSRETLERMVGQLIAGSAPPNA